MQHAVWVTWVPIISVWSYLFDGIFVGAAQAQAMFYSVLASLGALLPLWYLLQPWGNDGLWWAFLGFEQLRDCVTCGHEERIGQGTAARQEMTTRVNHTKPTAVQEVEPQVLKLK